MTLRESDSETSRRYTNLVGNSSINPTTNVYLDDLHDRIGEFHILELRNHQSDVSNFCDVNVRC